MKRCFLRTGFAGTLFSIFVLNVYCQNAGSDAVSEQKDAFQMISGVIELRGDVKTVSDSTFSADMQNQSVLVVGKGGKYEMKKTIIKKIDGSSKNVQYSLKYGLNAAVAILGKDALLKTDNSGIRSMTQGAPGLSLIDGAGAELNSLAVMTTMNYSPGITMNGLGNLAAKDANVTTLGAFSPALSSVEGRFTIKGGSLKTSAANSPCIFCKGTVQLEDLLMDAEASSCIELDGNHTLVLKNCAINNGLRRTVQLYQSDDHQSADGKSMLEITGGSLDGLSGMILFASNTTYDIVLRHVNLLRTSKKTILLKVAMDKWGAKNNNGAQGTLRTFQQELNGLVDCDKLSSCSVILAEKSSWIGAINVKNAAKNAGVVLDEGSTWTLTNTSYVQELTDAKADLSNIVGGGNDLLYDAKNAKNAWLGGKTIPLTGGGNAKPY